LDFSTSLQTYKSFTIALTLVNHHKKPALAERISLIMQHRFPNGPQSRATPRRPARTPIRTPIRTPVRTPTQTSTVLTPMSSSLSSVVKRNNGFQNGKIANKQKQNPSESYTNVKRRKLAGKNRLQKQQQSDPVPKDTPILLPKKSNPFSIGN